MNSSGHSFKGMTPHEAKESTILPFTIGQDFSNCLHLKQSRSSFSVWAVVNIRQTIYAPLAFLEPQSKHRCAQVQVRQTGHGSCAGFSHINNNKSDYVCLWNKGPKDRIKVFLLVFFGQFIMLKASKQHCGEAYAQGTKVCCLEPCDCIILELAHFTIAKASNDQGPDQRLISVHLHSQLWGSRRISTRFKVSEF